MAPAQSILGAFCSVVAFVYQTSSTVQTLKDYPHEENSQILNNKNDSLAILQIQKLPHYQIKWNVEAIYLFHIYLKMVSAY